MRPFDTATGTNGLSGVFPLYLGGHVGSEGSFAGTASFLYPSFNMAGVVAGRFYGPGAEELGASVTATSAAGGTFSAALTGQHGTGGANQNLTLTNIVHSQELSAIHAELAVVSNGTGGTTVFTRLDTSRPILEANGTMTYVPGGSPREVLTYNAANETSGPANFTSYQAQQNGRAIDLALYKPGPSNSELVLTYSSFGDWRQVGDFANSTNNYRQFFSYGILTPTGTLMRRTGSAHYSGVAYGAAINPSTSEEYRLRGTSTFDIDFSSQNYSGELALTIIPVGSAIFREIGLLSFSGGLRLSDGEPGDIKLDGMTVGTIAPTFYGPSAEEIGASFKVDAAGLRMVGIAAAVAD